MPYIVRSQLVSDQPAPAVVEQATVLEIAGQVQQLVDAELSTILPAREAEFQQRFARDGDMAYGALNTELFAPVRLMLKEMEIKATSRLPGDFQTSREWGNADETHQQRWMWSMLTRNGGAFGAIAVGSHHDHSCFRLPRPPEIIGLTATTHGQVCRELARLKPDFGTSVPFREWYQQFLAAGA